MNLHADKGSLGHARLSFNQELRHLEGSKMTKLSAIIDNSKDYDRLLEELTRPESRLLLGGEQSNCLNISMDAINLIRHQIHCGKSPTMALLNHWAITGRRRPTVKTLLAYLRLCNMRRAENYVRQEILGLKPELAIHNLPAQNGEKQPSIEYQPNDDIVTLDETYRFNDLEDLAEKLSPRCHRYSFDLIYRSANKFCHRPYDFRTKTGTKLGEGRFSSVYRASTKLVSNQGDTSVKVVAAKLLKSECNKAYLVNEINLIGKVNHENVLQFLGIALGESQDKRPAYICLIYPYMENGSLLDCLGNGLPASDFRFLTWRERVVISTQVARGISYLHNFEEGPIIHRDIKTANILLNENLDAKLGDFTIVRQIQSTSMTNETQYSQNIIGTSVYMPPEAFRGDISIKFDSFSFGIVLLELLTGMRPFNEEQNEDLLTYINERLSDLDDNSSLNMGLAESGIGSGTADLEEARNKFLAEILDKRAGKVDRPIECKIVFGIAMRATEGRKNFRPSVDEILCHLEKLAAQQDQVT